MNVSLVTLLMMGGSQKVINGSVLLRSFKQPGEGNGEGVWDTIFDDAKDVRGAHRVNRARFRMENVMMEDHYLDGLLDCL